MADWRSYDSIARIGGRSRRRRVPVILQDDRADAGATCLAMAMAFHGREVPLEELDRELGPERTSLDARTLIEAAQSFGMRARSVESEDLRELPRGSILAWEFGRFVVLGRALEDELEIIDPKNGSIRLPYEHAEQSFTGVAIVLEPGAGFRSKPRRGGRMRRYMKLIFSYRRLLSRVVVTSILLRLLALALPIATALIVDHVVPRSDLHLLTVIGVGLAGVVLFQMISSLIRAHLLLQLRTNLDISLTLDFLEHLIDLPYGFFQTRSTGDLMLRVASNSRIRRILTSNTLSALLDGSLVVIYLVVILLISPALGLLTLVLGLMQIGVFLRVRRRIGKLMREALSAQAKTQNYLVQVLTGIQTLKIAGAGQRAVERFSNFFVDELNIAIDNGQLQARIDAVMTGLNSASPLLILSAGALLVLQGELSLGSMLALSALAGGFLTPLASLVTSALELQQLSGYIERINDVFNTPVEQEGERAGVPQLSGRISLRRVSFRYDAKSPLVLREVDLEIEPGECVAIVGPSGSGKSTLASVLLGLYQPDEGSVEYDGRKLSNLDLRGVRRQIGYVPQEPYVFGLRLRDNIAMAEPNVSTRAIELAARRASIHEDIMAMRLGYDTVVSDGGGSLSGGQRQRVALARALVNEPPILILDEATSALDTRTEKRVMDALERMSCARVIIAHRLSTIAFADKIVVMDGGRVASVGTHAQLLERCAIYQEFIAASKSGPTGTLRVMGGTNG